MGEMASVSSEAQQVVGIILMVPAFLVMAAIVWFVWSNGRRVG